jgi:hypothetical protein
MKGAWIRVKKMIGLLEEKKDEDMPPPQKPKLRSSKDIDKFFKE